MKQKEISSTKANEGGLHTQGEWKVGYTNPSFINIYSEMFGGIAQIPADKNHIEEHKANAELIVNRVNNYERLEAVNKELYNALKNVVNMCYPSARPTKADKEHNWIIAETALKNAHKFINNSKTIAPQE